ncbi:DUF58 domain-containing protein [Clostridium swellfunianum]|uniref:DUF58 domain-containing protein n=1 Tax=Clostridium swellfunianum TaxID=1367462 RepID=UPI00202DE715|nr:DUF58 domain-containing protein [Clostridium swellfunianum]MCM0651087.1 DUF58 domain-containing protein [Clostridium swellfunianum]
MLGYFAFITMLIVLLALAEYTRRKGFDKLTIFRESDRLAVNEGEEFKITINIENNKWLPISFLLLKEKTPGNIEFSLDESFNKYTEFNYHITRYNIKWFERIKRSYSYKAHKRGTYLLKEIEVSIGDIFGFFSNDTQIYDYLELLVYPKLVDLKNIQFATTSLYGDSIIKRWIYKDPLYIKGIREYSIEDRMKDIHWKSSLKMNKLMVKDYDYTSEMELVIIVDVQCGELYWQSIIPKDIERGISVGASVARQAIKEGIPTGMVTNSQLTYYGDSFSNNVRPALNSLKAILELCARIDYTPRLSFSEFLKQEAKYFTRNRTYLVVTSYLGSEAAALLSKLRKMGFLIKLLDVSSKSDLPHIDGIEKAVYKEVV